MTHVPAKGTTVTNRNGTGTRTRNVVGTGASKSIVNNTLIGHRDRDFDHNFGRRHFDFDDFGFAWWSPWFWNWGYPGYYGYSYPWYYDYGYPLYPSYYSDYGYPSDYGYASPSQTVSNTYNYVYPAPSPEAAPAVSTEDSSVRQWYADAVTQFRQGNYREALRLAGHAAVDTPQDAKVHELISLALFALGDYRGASMEAHAALSFGPAADWPTLYGYYEDLPAYTRHLDALEKFSGENPSSLDAQFLLGYHNLMMGHHDTAKAYFAQVVAKASQDKLAEQLLKGLEGSPAPKATAPAAH